MRRSLARRAMAFTSASVGLRNISRSVSRTQALASRNVGVGMSCSMAGSCKAALGLLRVFRSQNRSLCLGTHAIKKGGRFPVSLLESLEELRRFKRTRQPRFVRRLLGRGFCDRKYRHKSAAVGFGTKLDMALDLG